MNELDKIKFTNSLQISCIDFKILANIKAGTCDMNKSSNNNKETSEILLLLLFSLAPLYTVKKHFACICFASNYFGLLQYTTGKRGSNILKTD